MKGRKPTSIEMKLLAGNFRGKPPVEGSDPFTCEELDQPQELDALAAEEWRRLTTFLKPVLSKGSTGMLLVAATAYSDMVTARKVLAERGTTYQAITKSGDVMLRPRPEVGILQNARRQYLSALCELGASPVSQTRLKKLPERQTAKRRKLTTSAYFTSP
jgi:P27 family predicted phage terminase small subunit